VSCQTRSSAVAGGPRDVHVIVKFSYVVTEYVSPSNISVIYASLKSTFSGLQFCRWQYRSTFIRFAVVASQICQITQRSEKIRTYSSSRSSKVIDLGANRKHICKSLIMTNRNLHMCSLTVTLDVSRTVNEILKARQASTRDRPHCPLTSSF